MSSLKQSGKLVESISVHAGPMTVAPVITGAGSEYVTVISPGRPTAEAIMGTPDELAAHLRAVAAVGVSHVQLVLSPITRESIERIAPVLALLDAG